MTIGERIQELRKRDGYSQEALAEKLGLSRQAVSKWESGAAIPTIDNLLELSRIFNVTIDTLLSAPAADTSPQDALSAVGVGKLLDEYAARQEKKRRQYVFYGVGIAALTLMIATFIGSGFNSRINQLKQDVSGLNSSIGSISGNLNGQMASFTQQLQEQLNAQESLVTDYSRTFVSYDPETRTLVFTVTATPKASTESMTATLCAAVDGVAGAPVEMQRVGNTFTATLRVDAEARETKFLLTLNTDGVAGNQLLETAYSIGRNYCMRLDATFDGRREGPRCVGEVVCTITPAYGDSYTNASLYNWPVSGRVDAMIGDRVADSFTIEGIEDLFTAQGIVQEDVTTIGECYFYTQVDAAYDGEVVFRVTITDNNGAVHTVDTAPY